VFICVKESYNAAYQFTTKEKEREDIQSECLSEILQYTYLEEVKGC
jgi:hypothetical protein